VKNYTFIKLTLATDGKKELLFAEGAGHKAQRRFLLPAPSYAHTRGLVPGVRSKGVEMAEKVVRAARDGPGGGGERWGRWWRCGSHTVGTSGHGCEFRTLGNASIRSSSNAGEK